MRRLLSVGMFACLAAWPVGARADIPPPNACAKAGEKCNTAERKIESGSKYDGAGICTQHSCTRAGPQGPHTYNCLLCDPVPAEPTKPDAPRKAGCSVSGGAADTSGLALIGLAIALARRRRHI